jgi:hypothetical protein
MNWKAYRRKWFVDLSEVLFQNLCGVTEETNEKPLPGELDFVPRGEVRTCCYTVRML